MLQQYNNTEQSALQEILAKTASKTAAGQRMVELARDVMPAGRLSDAMGCGAILALLHDSAFEHHRIATAYFCRNRMCPGCAWRQSAADALKISCILQEAQALGHDIVFATTTASNVEGADLREAIQDYDRAYTEMMRRGKFRNIIGAIRKFEITYNSIANTYHPHIHSVWIMPHGWRRKNNPAHITKHDLYEAWSTAVTTKYNCSPAAQDLRRADLQDGTSVLEFAKYSAKSSDYLISKPVFEHFYTATKGVRLLTYMRLCRKLNKAYKDGELDSYKKPEDISYIYRSLWNWEKQTLEYSLHELEELETPIRYGFAEVDIDTE